MVTTEKQRVAQTAMPSPARRSAAPILGSSGLPPGTLTYYRRIETYAQRIRSTGNVAEIIGILDEAMRDTHALAGRNELKIAHDRIAKAEREIAELKAELERTSSLVLIDQLTSALNRRGLEHALQRESARSDRHGTPLCMAMIDLDNFKRINDRYGHAAGDAALTHLAVTMRGALRPNDVVARYGGEEFVALLPDSDESAAFAAITRLQQQLAGHPIALGGDPVTLTFSAGISRRNYAEAAASMMERADAALLNAKRLGKNRIIFTA